ncbi:MAG: hypothetical protein LBM87_06640 [Ruminococcus sp.]|nr:hypothetical protein [Ruminococcus sp.]
MKKVTKTFTTFILLTALLLTSLATTGIFSMKVSAANPIIYVKNSRNQVIHSMASGGNLSTASLTLCPGSGYKVTYGTTSDACTDFEILDPSNGQWLNHGYSYNESLSISAVKSKSITYKFRDAKTKAIIATYYVTGKSADCYPSAGTYCSTCGKAGPEPIVEKEYYILTDLSGKEYGRVEAGTKTAKTVYIPQSGKYIIKSSYGTDIWYKTKNPYEDEWKTDNAVAGDPSKGDVFQLGNGTSISTGKNGTKKMVGAFLTYVDPSLKTNENVYLVSVATGKIVKTMAYGTYKTAVGYGTKLPVGQYYIATSENINIKVNDENCNYGGTWTDDVNSKVFQYEYVTVKKGNNDFAVKDKSFNKYLTRFYVIGT